MAEAVFHRYGRGAGAKRMAASSSSSQRCHPPQRKRGIKVVVIDDDTRADNNGFQDDDEDDEDCKITGCSKAPKFRQSKRVGAKRPAKWRQARDRSDTINTAAATAGTTAGTAATAGATNGTTAGDDLSDCEVEIGHSDIRKQWEEAAEKKRKFQRSARTKGSSAGKVGDGVSDGGPDRRKQSSGESVSTSESQGNEAEGDHVESKDRDQDRDRDRDRDQDDEEPCLVPDFLANFLDSHSKKQQGFSGIHTSGASPSNGIKEEKDSKDSKDSKHWLRRCNLANGFGDNRRTPPLRSRDRSVEPDLHARVESCGVSREAGLGSADFIADREKVKESDEFKRANEEEWQRRQEELQKQQQEAQKLKRRRKAEAERQLAMENRQKQRVEQVRENQIQEMKNNGIKELLRGHIQIELERKVAGCIDMATVLHRLGIPVEGGIQCTPEQVNAAYKKAILRFHPDRAAATANNDPRRQVEAEETFKLITKMKATLQLVPLPLKPRPHRRA